MKVFDTQWHLVGDGGRDIVLRYLQALATKHGYEWTITNWTQKGADEPAIELDGDFYCHTPYEDCGNAVLKVLRLLNDDGWDIEIGVSPGKPTVVALFRPGTMDGPSASCGSNCDIEGALWGCLYALGTEPRQEREGS